MTGGPTPPKRGCHQMPLNQRLQLKRTARQLERLMPDPFELDLFIEALGGKRRRPIHIQNMTFSADGGIYGAFAPAKRSDLIFVDSSATGYRLVQTICHEVAHIWLGHQPAELGFTGEAGVDAVLPMLQEASPELARNFLFRHDYGSPAERASEYLASLLMMSAERKGFQGRPIEEAGESFDWW